MSTWTISKLTSQHNKVFLITGANSGLGFYTATELAKKGGRIIIAVRNFEKGNVAKERILKIVPTADIVLMHLDLANLDSVKTFSESFKATYSRLDVLINNAGIMMPNERQISKQGFELQLATNHLGHFVLTSELMPLLESTQDARIVTVSSMAAESKVAKIYFDDMQFENNYKKMPSYAQSKLANIMFALELNKRLHETGSKVKSVAAHPGYAATNLQQNMGMLGVVMNAILAQKPEMGALSLLRAATSPDVAGGDYFGPTKMGGFRGHPEKVSPPKQAEDPILRQQLWRVTEQLTNETFAVGHV